MSERRQARVFGLISGLSVSYHASLRLDAKYSQRRPLLRGVRPIALPPSPFRPLARILISDDDLAIRRILSDQLTSHGFESLEAPGGDGVATLALANRARPHLVITDVNKPGLSGYALREALHADAATAGIPVLIVSAMEPWSDPHRAPLGPLDDYLVKPFTPEQLLYRIAALLPLGPAAHDRLAERARRLPCFEHIHPVTGLPCMHTLAGKLPVLTSEPGWAALSVEIVGFSTLVRARGRASADGLLASLGGVVSAAIQPDLHVAHAGFDPRIVLIGPMAAVDEAAGRIVVSFAGVQRQSVRLAPTLPPPRLHLRRAGDRAGLGLDLLELRAALRG